MMISIVRLVVFDDVDESAVPCAEYRWNGRSSCTEDRNQARKGFTSKKKRTTKMKIQEQKLN